MKFLKVKVIVILMIVSSVTGKASAQFVISEVIRITVTKVIKAIDLKVQRMQNKTIWLQNAQKVIENEQSRTRLTEISGWTDQQRQLFSNYYAELWKIKSAISKYQRIKDMAVKQAALVNDYRQAWNLFRQDKHFSATELVYMQQVYSGILAASIKNLNEIMMVVGGAKTRMTDEQRLDLVNHASDRLDENYDDLHRFNNQGVQLSLQRSKHLNDTELIKKLYAIK